MCLLDTKVARAKYVKNCRFSKNQPLFGWLRKNSEKKNSKNKNFGHSSIHKLSKKSNHKRFYRGSSEKPASLEPRDLLYPPRVTNRKNSSIGDPPSRGDSRIQVENPSDPSFACKKAGGSTMRAPAPTPAHTVMQCYFTNLLRIQITALCFLLPYNHPAAPIRSL